jgi:hypothetical protein
VALLKAYSVPGDPLASDTIEGDTWIVSRFVPNDRQKDHRVAGTRFLQLKEVLEKEEVETNLIQRAADYGL